MKTPGLIIDNFAGGGGASTGIEAALGWPIDVAINHDSEAIAMHQANHPDTFHYCQDVWAVDPLECVRTASMRRTNAARRRAHKGPPPRWFCLFRRLCKAEPNPVP